MHVAEWTWESLGLHSDAVYFKVTVLLIYSKLVTKDSPWILEAQKSQCTENLVIINLL